MYALLIITNHTKKTSTIETQLSIFIYFLLLHYIQPQKQLLKLQYTSPNLPNNIQQKSTKLNIISSSVFQKASIFHCFQKPKKYVKNFKNRVQPPYIYFVVCKNKSKLSNEICTHEHYFEIMNYYRETQYLIQNQTNLFPPISFPKNFFPTASKIDQASLKILPKLRKLNLMKLLFQIIIVK
eukprot:TRINITY_DN3862_c0_g1_i5.p3 TRINITY_DN3862_c0_g1~~TRINITY_DN3862_c0_g1_i5.p3  ORF type:complete len:208 (+),score=-14.94 TRINITY_DN3862_c0_g1_i5:80-625(+)